MQSQLIQGAVGKLEILVEEPSADEPQALAIVCHPHPLFEGTMHNKVAYMLARSFKQTSMRVIRFNFRGVGQSEGEHADGIGEVEDLKSVFAWAKERWPNLKTYLAGFSFGSYVALQFVQNHALCETYQLQGLIAVAPPVGRWDFSKIKMPECSVLIVQGMQDELVSASHVEQWVGAFEMSPKLIKIDAADHFFHGCLTQLRQEVIFWLEG